MKKVITLLLGCSLYAISATAQGTWTFGAPTDGTGTINAESARAICTDAAGNVYITGSFNGGGGATDFDLNSSTTNTFTSTVTDGFIASYDKNGAFRWKTIVFGTNSEFVLPAGGICTNGTFVWVAGSVNANPGTAQIVSSTNTVNITTTGTGVDCFVAKLNCSNGATQWQQAFGGTIANDFAEGICVDPGGSCYVSGSYSTAFTLGSINAPAPGGSSDAYIAKFTPGGTMRYFSTGGATANPDMIGNGSGICYVPGAPPAIVATGHTGASSANFGAFTGLANAGGNDCVLLELDTTLNFTNAMVFGNAGGGDELLSAVYDPFSGGVFVSGYSSGTVTFPGTAAVTGLGGQDIILGRYSVAANNFVWSSIAGGTANERSWCITSDANGGILISGHTASPTCTFSGSVNIPSNTGVNDLFVTRYSPNGTPAWVLAGVGSGAGSEEARGIASYVETLPTYTQTVFVTGIFTGTLTLGSTTLTSDGGNDFFLAKINDPALPLQATQSQVNLTCNGVCTGSATVVASGGTAPYTYSWSPAGGSAATASSLCAMNYTCTITDNIGTSITKTFNITQPTAIVVNANSQTNILCFGGNTGAASVMPASGGAGGYTYNWTPGNPTGDGTVSVTGLTAGSWSCTVTDAASCTATRTFNITAPPALGVTPNTQTNVACFGGNTGAASINTPTGGAGGYTYNWTPGNPTGDGTVSVTGLIAGSWTCTVTDANSCTITQTFNITAPPALVLNANTQTNVSCFGGTNGAASVLPATGGAGGYTYNWTPGNPTGDGTVSVTGLTAGSWTCTVTDANSCTTTRTFNITAPTAIVVTPSTQTNVACFGGNTGAASINTPTGGAGGYTYNWTPGNPTGDGTVSVTGLTAGSWTCTVTDANSCTATQTFNITAPAVIVVTPNTQTNVSCFGGNNGAASINTPTGGAGGYTYNWTPGNPTGDGTVSVTGLTAGSWTCTVTDANNCTATQTFNITAPTAIVVTPNTQTNVSCFGGSNGAASINTPTGGAGGYTYNWTPGNPTGDGTVSVTGLTAGSWTCTVTDVNSCTATQTFNITAPTALVVTPLSQTNVACNGGTTGAASVSVSGGTTAYSYNWTPGNPIGDGTASVSGLTASTWTCTVTDANSCTATQTFSITQPGALVVTALSQTNVACFGGSTGAASVSVSGGTTAYSYNWTPGNPTGDGTASVTGLTAGSWTCTVTDANSCVASHTFNITSPTAIVVTPNTQTNTSCFGGNNGAASINTPTGGAGGYTYNWTPGNPTGDGTVSVTGLTAGSWTCTVTDANSCTATQTFNITAPSAIVVTPASQTNISCFGGNNGAATINTPTGGAGGYTYNWTPGNPTGDGTVSVTGLTAGTWTCTVTDANSCTGTQTFNITAPAALVVSVLSQTNISCFGGSNGAASVSVSGGTTAYSYNWTPGNPTGDGTASVTGLSAGSWTCTVTDANSCVATQTFNITAPTAIVVTPNTQTNVSCFGGSNGAASINTPTGGAGGYTYNWTPGNPTGDGTVSVTGLTAGSWTCTVTDANSCTATQTFNITAPTAIVVTPNTQTNVSCFGGSNGAASINTPTGGAGGYTYNWTPGNPTGDGTVSVSGLTAGSWTCTVTDANSCTATQTFNITSPTVITASISSTPTSCTVNTGTATVSSVSGGAGGYTYSWTPVGGTGTTASNLGAGSYTCTITDVNGCSITRTVNVVTTSGPSLTAASQTNVACFGGSTGAAAVNAATGGTTPYTYNWTPGNPTGDGTVAVTGLTAGSWTCTVTDANGCSATVTFNITQPPVLAASAASQTNISCFGGSNGAASVSVTGGTTAYSYNWTPGNPTGDGTASVTGLTAGTWTCTVTDANSCVTTQTFNITAPTALVATPASQTNISCFGGSNGAASVSVTGGTTAYSYNWTPGNPTGDGTASVTGLTAGTWTCTVTDANSCVTTQTFNITAPAALVVTPASQTNISCFGGSNGAASVSVTGGTTAYSYNWTPGNPTGDGTASVTGLTLGTWTCTVTDANSCVATQTFNITQPTVLVVNALSQTNVACFGASSGAASVSVTGGTTAYSYNWTPGNPTGDGTASVTGLAAGTWTCTVTDANSCVATRTFNITQPPALVVTPVAQTNVSCFGGSNGGATVSVTGGTTGYTYNWTPGNPTGDGTVSVINLTAGTWTCTVTDANACIATQTFNITQPPAALAVTPLSQTNVACNGGSTGAASVSVSGGTTAYSYNWTPGNPTGDGTNAVTGLTAGTWTCTVTDANSCVATQTFNITQPTAITANITSTPTSCTANTGTATVSSVSGGVPSYTYNWTPGNPTGDGTPAVTGLAVGSWTCTITDANGCSITRTVNVVTATGPSMTAASQTNVGCNGASTGAATVNAATGGTTPYTYNWTPGNPTGDGTTAVTGLTAGTWTCTVTDANGCTATVTFNITQPTPLVVNALAQTNVSCNAGNNGAASVSVSGGTTSYSYNWTPGNPTGDGTASVTGLTAGTWTCTVTDANTCVSTQTFNITQPTALVVTPVSQTNILCFGGNNGAASVSVTGGTTAYSYNWTPGNPTGDGTASVTGLTAGSWTCTVTDANSCVTTQTFSITEPPVLTATPSGQTNVTCFGGNDGILSVTAGGGTPSYTYSWAPSGGNASTATGLTATTYTCTVTDANNCTTTVTFNLTEPPAVVVNVTAATNPICNGDCTTLTASGAATYSWSPGPLSGNPVTVCPATTTTYTVTGTDMSGCFGTATITVTVNPLPVVVITGDDSICAGDSTLLTGTSGGTSQWYFNGVLIPGATSDTYMASAGGVYNMIKTNVNTCNDSAATGLTLVINALPVVTASSTSVNVCNGDSATLTGSGASTYTWDNGVTDGVAFMPASTLTYEVTGTDANGCVNTDTITITVNPVPVVSLGPDTSSCAGSTIILDAGNAGSTFMWIDSTTAQTFAASANGTYWVDVTNSFGCTTRDSINLTFTSSFSVALGNDTAFCGDSLLLDAGNPGYSYLWNDSTTAQTLNVFATGTYYVTVTDSIGCTANDSINITITNGLNVALGSDMSNCTGSAITLDAGAFNNASYMWNDSTTAQMLTATGSGTYYVTVTDSVNGCIGTDTITVSINTAPVVSLGGTISSCATSYTFDAGTSGNVYLWIDSTTAQTLTVNTDGTYWVVVTDSVSGCTTSDTATITFTIPPVVTFTLSVDSICNTEPAFSISGTPAGGVFTGFGVVNGNQFSPGIGGPGVNVVTYTYTDQTGCAVSASDSLFVFQCIGINEVNTSISMNIYPNPNMGVFTIEAQSLNHGNIEVQIFNTLGQVIDAFPMTDSKRVIDITGYEGGIYSVRLTDGTSVLTQRIIKQ